jgi:hypothetical protein
MKEAAEFGGFVFKKGGFYANLPGTIRIDARRLIRDAKGISSSIGNRAMEYTQSKTGLLNHRYYKDQI